MAQTLKSLKKGKSDKKLINLKVSDDELKKIKANADKYAGGNVSGYLREAGKKWTPRKRDLVNLS